MAITVYGLAWVVSIAATHLALRPTPARAWQRALGSVLIGALALVVAAPTFAGARTLYDTTQLISGVLNGGGAGEDNPYGTVFNPWAHKARLNVLVLGGDAGADRTGNRTDTVMLASIDTKTGNTLLFSLPRQTERMPFPPGSALEKRWPRGFTSGSSRDRDSYFLNAIYDSVPVLAPEAFGPEIEDPGAEALKLAVGEALGLKVDYYAMVNLEGFVEMIDALGGITVNISQPVPVGGKNASGGSPAVPPDRWLPPGPDQHLNGFDALWFARGRYKTDDYHRMARQRCVIQAVVRQADPTRVAANYEALTKAGRNIVATDMPSSRLSAMLTLALKVKDGTMSSVSFENDKDGFYTAHPDWDLVRQRVRDAIDPPPVTEPTDPGLPQPPDSPSADPTSAADPSSGPAPSGNPSETPAIVDECAYNPVIP
ncbi:MAG: LCP family protein [Propioniciclava sp.]|uniref:LCP family protein n=1 Tax=Propioniciclava sp. TaxID=2038686 RepID=UPI0039E57659